MQTSKVRPIGPFTPAANKEENINFAILFAFSVHVRVLSVNYQNLLNLMMYPAQYRMPFF